MFTNRIRAVELSARAIFGTGEPDAPSFTPMTSPAKEFVRREIPRSIIGSTYPGFTMPNFLIPGWASRAMIWRPFQRVSGSLVVWNSTPAESSNSAVVLHRSANIQPK
jgi:hypothetical protein